MKDLPFVTDPNLIVGMEHSEDAGVYRLREDLAIIQTLDFFTPIVDDPYIFGQIAVVNALSDVYAMGGRPVTAMNIVCFPIKTMPLSILRDILRGGMDKMKEAGVLLVGGHSVEDDELKYGLSVTGVIHPDKVLLNRGGQAGDKLILTKALGTGIVSTAVKAGVADEALQAKSVQRMATLNKQAAEMLEGLKTVHACTDVTGFGFLGHSCEIIENANIGMRIYAQRVPYFDELKKLLDDMIIPGGTVRNKRHRADQVVIDPACPDWMMDILFDPQTSGGLLIVLGADEAEVLLRNMHDAGMEDAALVGEITDSPKGKIDLVW
ncbi:MAG: selenide, water dikinase SelD [Syntrophaceae bacterium]|nr:selenide, water dikinase SelD [Syntrophaceae bacterium]